MASWRKLELSSWLDLLQSREAKFARRSRIQWVRLYSALQKSGALGSEPNMEDTDVTTTSDITDALGGYGKEFQTSGPSIVQQRRCPTIFKI